MVAAFWIDGVLWHLRFGLYLMNRTGTKPS